MKILCIETKKLPEKITKGTFVSKENFFELIDNSDICWIERSIAEESIKYQQIIPYILLKKEDGNFACYQRHGTEKRLHNKYSAGVGGHIDEPDNQNDLQKTIEKGMFRELSEELSNFQKENITLKYLGIIRENETVVGLMHIGIVYIAECKEGYIPEATSELKNMEWKSIEDINKLDKELWTELAFSLIDDNEEMKERYVTYIKTPDNFDGKEDYWDINNAKLRKFLQEKNIYFDLRHCYEDYLDDRFVLWIDKKDVSIIEDIKNTFGYNFEKSCI